MIEWGWRIADACSTVCGSGSGDALWEPSFERLVGRTVIEMTTFGRLPDLLISLSGDLHLASFRTAEGDPGWTLSDRRGGVPITLICRSTLVMDETQARGGGDG